MPDIILIELITQSAVAVVTALLMVRGSFQSVFMLCVFYQRLNNMCVCVSERWKWLQSCVSVPLASNLLVRGGRGGGEEPPKVVPGSFPEGTFWITARLRNISSVLLRGRNKTGSSVSRAGDSSGTV